MATKWQEQFFNKVYGNKVAGTDFRQSLYGNKVSGTVFGQSLWQQSGRSSICETNE
jgi:hypothetical protein